MSAIHLQVKIHRSAFKLDLDVQLPGQGITAIFGPSGSGKTTLLRAVAGSDLLVMCFKNQAWCRISA